MKSWESSSQLTNSRIFFHLLSIYFPSWIISQPLKIACAQDALRCREHRQLGERDDQVTCRMGVTWRIPEMNCLET